MYASISEIQSLRQVLQAAILRLREEVLAEPGYDQVVVDALTRWYWRLAAAGEREVAA